MTEKQTTEAAAKKVAGGREDVKAESQKASDKAAATHAKAAPDERPVTGGATYHAPSQPDQASMAEQDAADNAVAFRGVEGEYAPDNAIEATVRRMAAEGATAGELAAYRADALAKLGD